MGRFVGAGRTGCEGASAFVWNGNAYENKVPVSEWDKPCMMRNKDGTAISGFIAINLYPKAKHCQSPAALSAGSPDATEHGLPWMQYLRCFSITMPGASK